MGSAPLSFKITSILLLSVSSITFAADGDAIDQISRKDAINYILSPENVLSEEEQIYITDEVLRSTEASQRGSSRIYDNVEPVRAPIFFDTSPSSEPAVIYVTPSRPTTISFFKQGGETLPVVNYQEQKLEQSPQAGPRFEVMPIEEVPHAYTFKTSLIVGETSVDFFFKGLNYSIPFKIVAGRKYHSSAQAIMIDSDPMFKKANGTNDDSNKSEHGDIALNGDISTKNVLRQQMFMYANFQQKPPRSAYKNVNVEFFSSSSHAQPIVDAILTTIEGRKMFLIYTNGHLRSPDFQASEPSNTPSETIWVYAVPEEDVPNLISIVYAGGTHLLSLEVSQSLGLNRSVTTVSELRR